MEQEAYYVDASTVNSTSTEIWVEADALAAGVNTLYLFYGNPNASFASSAANTFVAFEDFTGNSIGADWVIDGNGQSSLSNNQLTLQSNGSGGIRLLSASTVTSPVVVETNVSSIGSGDFVVALHDASNIGYGAIASTSGSLFSDVYQLSNGCAKSTITRNWNG